MLRILKPLAASVMIVGLAAANVNAAETPELPEHRWSFEGLFGTFDRGAAQRGLHIYRQICSGCHSLRLISFRHLTDIGYSPAAVEAIAGEYEVEDCCTDAGDTYFRPAKPSDYFPSPFPNEQAARAANGGALPPDLSTMVRSRIGGPDYVRALLTGYEDSPPPTVELMPGMYYNEYFPGHQIAMAPPLIEEGVEYPETVPASVDQQAEDITTFLSWTSMPEMEDRKRLGVTVILFLIVLSGLLFAIKKRIWSHVH